MSEALTALTIDGWLARMQQLALRQGVHLSTLQQKGGGDLELVFASATLAFPRDQLLNEHDANETLKMFLATAGLPIRTMPARSGHCRPRRVLTESPLARAPARRC